VAFARPRSRKTEPPQWQNRDKRRCAPCQAAAKRDVRLGAGFPPRREREEIVRVWSRLGRQARSFPGQKVCKAKLLIFQCSSSQCVRERNKKVAAYLCRNCATA